MESEGSPRQISNACKTVSAKAQTVSATRTDEQKLHIRLAGDGRACQTKRSPILHESPTVNEAVT